jgi:response regulator NasT
MTAAGATSKGSILVVDDNRLVLATLTDGLTRAGYHVFDADNGDDAILLARAHRPDLALLDIRMEGKSGFDVAQYLRTQCQMPFMFLSAFSDEHTVAQVKALGAVAYLVKPLDIMQIVAAVEALDATTAMAVGVLMHRYSLTRGEATERLLRQAADVKRSPRAEAELLLAAVEQLAGPARH